MTAQGARSDPAPPTDRDRGAGALRGADLVEVDVAGDHLVGEHGRCATLLDWLRASEVSFTGGRWGLGTIRGGPYPDNETADVSGLWDANRPPIQVGDYWTPAGHDAIDATAGHGTPIQCVGNGHILRVVNEAPGRANAVYVDHGNGWVTGYVHLLYPPSWAPGEAIGRGALIGFEDTSGLATGPHLHFTMSWMGTAVDPLTFLAAGPDLAPMMIPVVGPQVGDASPEFTLNVTQQLQHLLGSGTVAFTAPITAATGEERYYSVNDGVPRLLPAGALCRAYSVYIPLEGQP